MISSSIANQNMVEIECHKSRISPLNLLLKLSIQFVKEKLATTLSYTLPNVTWCTHFKIE